MDKMFTISITLSITNSLHLSRFSANTPAIVDEVVPNYSATVNGADRYNGLSTIPTLMAAVKALQWDESIWDLSGEKPRLVWELAQ